MITRCAVPSYYYRDCLWCKVHKDERYNCMYCKMCAHTVYMVGGTRVWLRHSPSCPASHGEKLCGVPYTPLMHITMLRSRQNKNEKSVPGVCEWTSLTCAQILEIFSRQNENEKSVPGVCEWTSLTCAQILQIFGDLLPAEWEWKIIPRVWMNITHLCPDSSNIKIRPRQNETRMYQWDITHSCPDSSNFTTCWNIWSSVSSTTHSKNWLLSSKVHSECQFDETLDHAYKHSLSCTKCASSPIANEVYTRYTYTYTTHTSLVLYNAQAKQWKWE
jgi:hypothetical protein